jgi:hypothetical protein
MMSEIMAAVMLILTLAGMALLVMWGLSIIV